MIRKNPRGDLPQVHHSAFVDPTAILCGKVVVEENVFIGPYAVIRADEVDDEGNLAPIVGTDGWRLAVRHDAGRHESAAWTGLRPACSSSDRAG